jgi:hypothetical protein
MRMGCNVSLINRRLSSVSFPSMGKKVTRASLKSKVLALGIMLV